MRSIAGGYIAGLLLVLTCPGQSADSASSIEKFALSKVRWLHTNVSGWAQTAKLSYVKVQGNKIYIPYNKANVWKANKDGVNGNPWIFVYKNGVWYGATWEWLRKGQTAKAKRAVQGDHIKKDPLRNFVPKSGEIYGFMISGLARTSERNVKERSNIVLYRWP